MSELRRLVRCAAAVAACIWLGCGTAAADEPSAVALTIYSTTSPGAIPPDLYRPQPARGGYSPPQPMIPGYAVVKQERELTLQKGRGTVRFSDVAAQIDPTTVHLRSLTDPAGLKILEQNYEYDLLSSQKLLEKYVGRKVRLYQSGGSYLEGTLLSTNGPVYEINGQIHMGHAGNVVLPALPENLVSKPTLVWLLRNATGAPQRVEAAYLTGGITWKADYVMLLGAGDDRADLTGWVTTDNRSGAT